jgi:RNA polymerase sigma-70 factor (ECF subfamily)
MTNPEHARIAVDHDAALLHRVRAGESEALDELLGRALGIARRYSAAVCGRAPDREDAVQEALLQTFRHAHGIREPRAFRSWLYRAVKNACLIGRRRSGSRPAVSSLDEEGSIEAVDPSRAADDRLLAAEDRERVRLALGGLPASYREAVFLRDFEGLSTREVARVLGITEANVKVRLHRAHAQLRRRLEAPKQA